MANRRGKLSILIEAKNLAGKAFLQVKSQARSAAGTVSSGFSRAREGLAKFRGALTGLVAGFATFAALRIGRELFKIGASAVETASKFGTVFGPELERMNEFLEENAARMGLSRREMQELTASAANLVQGIGATVEESAQLSKRVVTVAADIRSFSNVQEGTADVANRVTRALLGEREGLKSLDIAVSEREVKEVALQQTRKDSIEQVTALEKAQATLTVITRKAGQAIGDLDRTQQSAANRAERLGAEFRTLKETIAVAVLPIFDELLETVDSVDFLRFAAALETDVGEAFRNLGIVIGARLGQGIFTGLEKFADVLTPKIGGLATGPIGFAVQQLGQAFDGLADLAAESAEDAAGSIGILAEAGGSLQNVTAAIQAARDRLANALAGVDTDDAEEKLKNLAEAGREVDNALIALEAKESLLGDAFDEPAERAKILKSAIEAFTEAGLDAEDTIPGLGRTLGDLSDEFRVLSAELDGFGARARDALAALSGKQAAFGESFDEAAERAKILEQALSDAVEAGLEMGDMIPGLGMTVGDLAFEYQRLSGEIKGAENRAEAYAEAQEFLGGLLRQTETEADRYAQVVARLNALFGAGLLSQEQFSEGLAAAREVFEGEANAMEQRAERLADNISRAVGDALTSGLTELGESVGQLLAQTGEQTASLGDIVTATMGGLLKTIGQSLIAFGTAGIAIKKFIANPFAAIAAGVALVALGSALSASAQSAVASTGSALASGTPATGGGSPTAGAGFDREFAGIGGGNLTLVIEGGDLLDMSNPKTERQLSDAFEDLTGRRVTVIRRT